MTAENEPNSWKGVIESNQEIEWPDYFKNRQEWTHFLRKCNPVPSKEIGRIFHDQTRRKFHLEGSHQFPTTKGMGRLFHNRMGIKPVLWKEAINAHQQRELPDYFITEREWNQFFQGYDQFLSTKRMGRLFHDRMGMKPIVLRISSIPINKGNGQIIPWPDGKVTTSWERVIHSIHQRNSAGYSWTGQEWSQLFRKEMVRIFLDQ